MAQLASMVDPTITRTKASSTRSRWSCPRARSCSRRTNKPAALGSFHPAVRGGRGDLHRARRRSSRERSSPQVYKLGMPNAVIGFDERGQMWMDQGVDVRASDASAAQGVDGWGAMCSGLGQPDPRHGRGGREPLPGAQPRARADHRYGRRRPLARAARHRQREAGPEARDRQWPGWSRKSIRCAASRAAPTRRRTATASWSARPRSTRS